MTSIDKGNGGTVRWERVALSAFSLLSLLAILLAGWAKSDIAENRKANTDQDKKLSRLETLIETVLPSIDKRLEDVSSIDRRLSRIETKMEGKP